MSQNVDFLKNVKAGDLLVRTVNGGGFVTESLVEIEAVKDNGIFIEGADEDYADDSVYRFSKENGRSVNNYTQGFFSKLVRFATDEDKEELVD